MTPEELVRGFMRLATDDKIAHPVSEKFKRRRAGRKGIGRFAAERLGKKLTLTTATVDASSALRVEIDWERFAPGKELGAISAPITMVPKERLHGTTLRIERLRDNWPPATIERTFQHIAELIDLGDQTKSKAASGAEFAVSFTGDSSDHKIFDIRSQVAEQAYATIRATIDESGHATWGLNCPALKIQIKTRDLRFGDGERAQAAFARSTDMVAKYYLLESRYFPPAVFRTVQNYLATHGGIRVYRNGFRVLPYGQEGDDWLGLDLTSSRRTRTLAPVRNRNFLGSVSIDDESGLFEETSSREGLIGSEAFNELVDAMHAAIIAGVREIDAERERLDLKRERPAKPPVDQPGERPPSIVIAQTLTEALQTVREEIESGTSISPVASAALQRATASAEEVSRRARESDALLKEIDLLRVLASMGLAIGQFTHEFSSLSGAMRASLAVLLESGRTEAERLDAASAIRTLLDQARAFTGLYKSMTEENTLRERQPQDLYAIATSFRSAMNTVFQRNGVTMEIEEGDGTIISPPMHRSELFAVFLNFSTNSIKAIKRASRAGRILLRLATRPDGGALIEFADNGDGIAAEVENTLFDPFVTTTAAKRAFELDDEAAIGSGLGLAIVRDIVFAAGGTVSIGKAPETYVTCLIVTLPPVSHKE